MKTNLLLFSIFLCGIISFTGCSEEPTPASTPPINSKIILDRTVFGVGQPIAVSIKVPTPSKDVESVEYSFYIEGVGLSNIVTPEDETCSTIWTPTNEGSATIVFNARYTFVRSDKNGEIFRSEDIKKTITAIPCDVRNSFWGDNLEETRRNCKNELIQTSTPDQWYTISDNPFSSNIDGTPYANVIYTFGNSYSPNSDNLSSVEDIYTYDVASTASPFLELFRYLNGIEKVYNYVPLNILWNAKSDAIKNAAESCHSIIMSEPSDYSNEDRVNARKTLSDLISNESISPFFFFSSSRTSNNRTTTASISISLSNDKKDYLIKIKYMEARYM